LEEAMKRSWLVQLVPITITRIHAGDKDLIGKLYVGLASTDNPAIYYTVLCHDVGALFDASTFSAELEKHPELESRYAADNDASICAIWEAGQTDPAEPQSVQSQIPTLILNGSTYDSATPPAYAELAASTLSHSFLYEFQKYTHSVSFEGCPKAMIADFLNNPSDAPDSSCMAQMKGISFITDVYPNKGALNIFSRVQDPYSPFSLVIGLLGLIFFSAIVLLPVVSFIAHGQSTNIQLLPGFARFTLWIVSALNLVFMFGAWILSKKALAENYGWVTLVGFSPSSSQYLFLLPWLASLLTLVLLVFLLLAWKNHWWNRLELVLFNLGTLAALSLTGILIYLKILSI
jgi:hypothetical protein